MLQWVGVICALNMDTNLGSLISEHNCGGMYDYFDTIKRTFVLDFYYFRLSILVLNL